MKGLQKYATRVFYSLKHAEDFKKNLGIFCLQTIKQDILGKYKVKWLIDKNTIKYQKR